MTVSRQDFEDAVAAYWGAKQAQNELSNIRNKVGAGTAGSVRGGKHFDVIAALLAKFFLDAGYPPDAIRIATSQRLELPGYYRPQKMWDVVVAWRHFSAAITARITYLQELGLPGESGLRDQLE